MHIELSPQAKRFVNSQLEQGSYSSASAVIDALVAEKQCHSIEDDAEEASRQRAALLKTLRECEALVADTQDEFSNRDHDRILYGDRS